jgi:hypothetical protein
MYRPLRLLAVVALFTLISAGCSTAPSESSTGDTTVTSHDQAVQFAECMRANGVPGFPDPDASGSLTIENVANGTSVDTNSAAWQQAMDACKDLEPAGFTGTTRTAEQQHAALVFAQCIRDHGVPDFPDPGPDDPMIDTNKIPSANQPGGMDILHAAMNACSDDAAAAGVTGGQ